MTGNGRNHRLDLLILARIGGSRARKPPGPAKLRQSLAQLAGRELSPAELKRQLDDRVASLVERGLLIESPFAVTEEGSRFLCRELGLDRPPTWTEATQRYLPMLGLGLAPGSPEAKHSFASTEHVQAALLAQAHQLPLKKPTLEQVVNALTARALATKPTIKTSKALRPAITEQWVVAGEGRVGGEHVGGAGPVPDRPAPAAPGAPPLTLDELATAVRAAVAEERAGRFGDRKVYVSALFRRLQRSDSRFGQLSLDDLKGRLVEANQRRLLTLARADYVSAMDPAEVEASHIHHLNRDFHFVLDESVDGSGDRPNDNEG